MTCDILGGCGIMHIIYRMAIFSVLTIFVMLLITYLVSLLEEVTGREVATFIFAILLSIYLIFFDMINDRTGWMKF